MSVCGNTMKIEPQNVHNFCIHPYIHTFRRCVGQRQKRLNHIHTLVSMHKIGWDSMKHIRMMHTHILLHTYRNKEVCIWQRHERPDLIHTHTHILLYLQKQRSLYVATPWETGSHTYIHTYFYIPAETKKSVYGNAMKESDEKLQSFLKSAQPSD